MATETLTPKAVARIAKAQAEAIDVRHETRQGKRRLARADTGTLHRAYLRYRAWRSKPRRRVAQASI